MTILNLKFQVTKIGAISFKQNTRSSYTSAGAHVSTTRFLSSALACIKYLLDDLSPQTCKNE